MHILINSDILFTSKLVSGHLPSHLEAFARECIKANAVVVLTRTVLLEVERRQQQLLDETLAKLENAYAVLRNAGIPFEERSPVEMFSLPDFVELFRQTGAQVEIEETSLADFIDAERRACLHLSPQPPETKSDEMRDLIIWAVALRVASKHGGAILLSRDEVHTHSRGGEEASSVKLVRARGLDEALELLGVESPAGRLAKLLLEPIWDDLRASGLPVLAGVRIRAVSNASFVLSEAGLQKASFSLKAEADEGRTLTANVDLQRRGELITRVEFQDIKVDNLEWQPSTVTISPNKPVQLPLPRSDESLEALREIIGE